MNDDKQMEILAGLGVLEAQMEEQRRSMAIICEFKDIALGIFQKFDDYKETRKSLPTDVQFLKDKINVCHVECAHRKVSEEEVSKQVKYLMTWSHKIAGAQIVISALAALIVILVQLKILKPW